jgi:hypothetical protein
MSFEIEDQLHAEHHSSHPTLAAAIAELRRLALIPWDQGPNLAPCTGWRNCGRQYEIVEYDTSSEPWRELQRLPALEIDSQGVRWAAGLPT